MKKILILLVMLTILQIEPKTSRADGGADPVLAAGLVRMTENVSAPTFVLEDVDGEILRLEDFRGRVVLLDFWATW